ncbi:MAG: VCBS repeat-containing protein [Candidatus Brockarchaeota archaeon]|nr:VCBS repeat-containing protein [Candidatus Brockarchaeota archaeon]
METKARKKLRFEHVIVDALGPKDPHVKIVGDVNGDGFPDIVVASSGGGPLVWYEYPNWIRRAIVPSGGWSTDGKLADIDGDGDLDIAISEYANRRLEWYENPLPRGDPARDPWKLHTIGEVPAHDVCVGDIDRDGLLEIAARQQAKQGDEIVIWKRVGSDLWKSRTIDCPIGEGLALGDVDGDGRLDVVIGGNWYEAPKDIMEQVWNEHGFADWTPDAVVRLVDMNGDGRLDVVLTRSEGHYRLSWFEAPADPKAGWKEHWAGGRDSGWIEHVVDDSVDFAHSLSICDIDKDGLEDIVTAEMHQSSRKRVMVYINRGGAVRWTQQVVATTGSHNICVADIGNDGKMDIVGANWSGAYQPVELWLQK